jgi:hypothetical protein
VRACVGGWGALSCPAETAHARSRRIVSGLFPQVPLSHPVLFKKTIVVASEGQTARRHVLEYLGHIPFRRMPSYGMLRRVALLRTDVSKELSASIIKVTRIAELGTTFSYG